MRPQQNFVSLRVPRNLRSVWPYPNLLHFEKFVDLLLLSASNEKVAYNKAVVIVPVGHVLLKYAFFVQRWKVSVKSIRSLINVLSIAGWLKIERKECASISNQAVSVPLVSFPNIGYDNGFITITATNMTTVGYAVSFSDTESYKDEGQRLGTSEETSSATSEEPSRVGSRAFGRASGREQGRADGGDVGSSLITSSLSVDYEDIPQQPGHSSGSGTDHSEGSGEGRLIIYKDDDDEYIKKKNKKEKNKPEWTDVESFAAENGIPVRSAEEFFRFYEASGWQDQNGRTIRNWKKALLRKSEKERGKHPPAASPPTAADKLARQNANLARNLAAHVADS